MNRLVEKLTIYDIDLRYKKYCNNSGADYLKRNACKGIYPVKEVDSFEELRKHHARVLHAPHVPPYPFGQKAMPFSINIACHFDMFSSRSKFPRTKFPGQTVKACAFLLSYQLRTSFCNLSTTL
jgi:hypothetical protein